MDTRVVDLAGAVERLLELDTTALSPAELDDLVAAIEVQRARLDIATARLQRDWVTSGSWQSNGSKSASHRLAGRTGTNRHRVERQIRRAVHLDDQPAPVTAAVLDGDISIDTFDLLTTTNTESRRGLFQRDTDLLLDECRHLRHFHQVRRLVNHWANLADDELSDPTTPTPSSPADCGTLYTSNSGFDGSLIVAGTIPAIPALAVTDELDRIAADIRMSDITLGLTRTRAQLRAAALVEMARRSNSLRNNGAAGVIAPLFVVHIGEGAFSHLIELASGTPRPTAELVPYVAPAMLQTVLFDGPTTLLGVSKQRSFAGALRTAITARDRTCRHPSGCDTPSTHCDIDHIIPWCNSGPTATWNGRAECPTHNRHAHLHDHDTLPHPEHNPAPADITHAEIRWQTREHHRHTLRRTNNNSHHATNDDNGSDTDNG